MGAEGFVCISCAYIMCAYHVQLSYRIVGSQPTDRRCFMARVAAYDGHCYVARLR
jgi:hypothetical protein